MGRETGKIDGAYLSPNPCNLSAFPKKALVTGAGNRKNPFSLREDEFDI
jgi:hypothetical protein